ncbi:MAG: antibiotic biosynthesis monooxygenase [Bacteroidetes bacterium]|nr:antibiotic biosynthesis monooxygenase [Bacteroidota bacterium]
MLVRIVKMSFSEIHIDEFLANFNLIKERIRNFKGCSYLELYRDKNHPNIFFTYSYWDTEADLENYRHSTLFKEVWANTKPFFNDKPQAWSVDKVVSLD